MEPPPFLAIELRKLLLWLTLECFRSIGLIGLVVCLKNNWIGHDFAPKWVWLLKFRMHFARKIIPNPPSRNPGSATGCRITTSYVTYNNWVVYLHTPNFVHVHIHVGECRSSWQVYQPSHWDQCFSPSSSWHSGIGFRSQVSIILTLYPGPSIGIGERAWYTLHTHALNQGGLPDLIQG